MVAAVADLLPVFRQRAQETEDNRVVPAESVKALAETGFFRLLQPASYGGLEADPIAFFTAVRLIASACGSTGWVASVLGVHPWQLALFPAQAQEDVWGADPGARMSSSYAPTGRARAVEGGYRLDGPVELLLRLRPRELGAARRRSWSTATASRSTSARSCCPPATTRIDDVWDTVGLRGTGSNDIVVDGALVPAHRSLSFTDVTRCACPGQERNPGPLYRIPYGSVFSNAITTPIIGMATGAYAAHVAYQRDRVRASYAGQKAAEDVFGQVRIAEAAGLLDAAWLALERNMSELMAHARRGREAAAAAAAAGQARPGDRHRAGDPRGGPAVREFRRPRAEARDADPAVLARRARRAGARDQRPGTGAVDVRPRRVRARRAAGRDVLSA